MGTVKRFRIKSFKKQKPVVSLNNVSLSFGDRNILKNISFNIEPGIYGLLGPNGSGKSTLFNLITGNLKPDSGSIYFGETIATDIPIYLRTRMFNIGFVPQIGGIFHSLTLLDNLKCIGEILIKDKREMDSKINYLINKFDLDDIKNIKATNLSGGEKRKTAIAAALLGDPNIILLDEPFAALDILTIQMLQKIIVDLQVEHHSMCVLLADHQPRELLAVCDKALILSNSHIVAKGSPNELLNNVHARKHYFGDKFKA